MKIAVGDEYQESDRLLRSSDTSSENAEQEDERNSEQAQPPQSAAHSDAEIKHSDDRGFSYSARRLTVNRLESRDKDRVVLSTLDPPPPPATFHHQNNELRDSSPPEWALLLLGCLLGLATGLFVAAFNSGVFISSLINHICS